MQFNPTMYTVTEGDSVVTVTLEALNDHEFPFNVTVNTVDGTAGRRLITLSGLFYIVLYKCYSIVCQVDWTMVVLR